MGYPRDIKEVSLIKSFAARLKSKSRSVVVSIGDDAAVVRGARGSFTLYTTDMLIESVHFKKSENFKKVGYKAMSVCISDIAAMGGVPKYALVSVGLSKRRLDKTAKELFVGIASCAKKFNIDVIGGDTNRSSHLVIDVFMVGEVEREKLVLRSTARPGDCIFVSGPLGGALRGRHLTFEPRLKESRFLVKNFKPTSMIDLSDGLAQDLNRVAVASKVGALIFEDKIPKSKESKGSLGIESALFDGEDFQLLFTLSGPDAFRLMLAQKKKKTASKFYYIGVMTQLFKGVNMITHDMGVRRIGWQGYKHF